MMLNLDATIENLDEVISFLEAELEERECGIKALHQIEIAAEEIFVNIAHYAYGDSVGKAEISFDFDEESKSAIITFKDSGTPYNPLEKADPDITVSADEREIGGLGIFMVKKSMDDVRYEYTDGQNVLTLVKRILP